MEVCIVVRLVFLSCSVCCVSNVIHNGFSLVCRSWFVYCYTIVCVVDVMDVAPFVWFVMRVV